MLKVDGKEVRTLQIPKTIPFLLPGDETFDVGVDTRTGVNDQDYQVPFAFNGKISQADLQPWPGKAHQRRASDHSTRSRQSE